MSNDDSNLSKISDKFLICNINRNVDLYVCDKPYNETNSRALSDNDEWGRGEYNNSIGTCVDINKRSGLVNKNKFTGDDNKYGEGNCLNN